jgi:hypothetical protein
MMSSAHLQRHWTTAFWAAILVGVATLVVLLWWAAVPASTPGPYTELLNAGAVEEPLDDETEAQIREFCGDCHAVPRPESFHRDAWTEEVAMGYDFYARSGRTDLVAPPMDRTVAYFRARAPDRIAYPTPPEAARPFAATFTVERLSPGGPSRLLPAIADLRWCVLRAEGRPVLVACDMHGAVVVLDVLQRQQGIESLAVLRNPCHVEPCDLDADGLTDLVVADLGSFQAADHDRGRVVWLRQNRVGRFDEVVVATGLGRVDDVRPADFDGDGDTDLLVADFGFHRTGKILLLENRGPRQRPQFEAHEIDPRPGTTTLPLADFNGDGRLDFVAAVSQEYETIDLFLNQGQGRFHRRTLWTGPDLTFGTSTIDLVDLDEDGDTDVLCANGDSFDNRYVPPWHGAQWLENLGDGRFAYHRLTDLSGACRIRAADLDLDGDLDLVVSAFLPSEVKPNSATPDKWASLVLLEQVGPGRFVRHTLETGYPYHASLEIADFDHDGDLDLAVGTHGGPREKSCWFAIWWNEKVARRVPQ